MHTCDAVDLELFILGPDQVLYKCTVVTNTLEITKILSYLSRNSFVALEKIFKMLLYCLEKVSEKSTI
jgi:hypothetical protein